MLRNGWTPVAYERKNETLVLLSRSQYQLFHEMTLNSGDDIEMIFGDLRQKWQAYLGTSRYLLFTRPPSNTGSTQAILVRPNSRRFPSTATPAGPAPTTTAA